MPSALEQLLSETSIGKRQAFNHAPTKSAYQQFQQEYPGLDAYGSKVASGRQFKETMGTLASALDNTSGQLMEGKADTGAGNIMDYLGVAGVTKKLTPSENSYFEMILGSPADKKELYEAVPSFRVKKGVASVSQDDSGKLADYIDDTYNLNEGMRLPPSFYSGDFAKKFNFDDADRSRSGMPAYDDLMKQLEPDNLPAMLRKQSDAGDLAGDIEYHLSSEPNLVSGKTFAEQKRTVSSVGERGYGAEGQGDNIFTTRDPQSWRDQFEMELSQDAPESIPKYLYEVRAKNPSPEGYLGEATNAPGDVTVLRRLDPLGAGSIPYMLKKQN